MKFALSISSAVKALHETGPVPSWAVLIVFRTGRAERPQFERHLSRADHSVRACYNMPDTGLMASASAQDARRERIVGDDLDPPR